MFNTLEELMKDIIFIGYAPLTNKISTDFFINDLLNDGYNVKYWDLTELFFPELSIQLESNCEIVVRINQFNQLEKLIIENKKTSFFINFPYEWRVLKIFKLLTNNNVQINIIARGMLPLPSLSYNLSFAKILSKLRYKTVINFFRNKYAFNLKKNGVIKTFDNIFYAGNNALKIAGVGYKFDIQKANLIPINSADYDKCLLVEKSNNIRTENYAVFLDDYLPFHPDFYMFDIKTIDSVKYYQALNNFFLKLEDKYNFKVIIAAHPKAELYAKNNYFEGREVIFGKTIELVKDCQFAIGHMSTSIGFAVMFKKKILFTYTDDLYNIMLTQYNIIKFFSETLNSTLVNIDSDLSKLDIKLDEEKYKSFIRTYLASEETEKTSSYSTLKQSINYTL